MVNCRQCLAYISLVNNEIMGLCSSLCQEYQSGERQWGGVYCRTPRYLKGFKSKSTKRNIIYNWGIYVCVLLGPPTSLQLFYNDGGDSGHQILYGTADGKVKINKILSTIALLQSVISHLSKVLCYTFSDSLCNLLSYISVFILGGIDVTD